MVELGSICELVMGQSPSSDTYNADGEGLPFYQGNADFGEKNPIPHVWCTEPKKVAEKGDILVSVRAPIGAINIASEQCCIGRGVAAIRPRLDFVSADFLMHQLLASRKNLELMGTGSTFKAVGKKALNGFAISIYPKGDQDKIADQLDCIIQQIKATETQVAQLDQLVKSRFVEMFGDLEHGYKCSSCKLELIAEVGSSKRVFKNELLAEGVPFYRGTEIADLSAGGSIKPSLFISKEHYERLISSTGKPEIGDLLLPSICPDGQIWCVNTNAPFYFKDGRVLWIRPDRDAVDGVYLRHALSTMLQMSFSNIASGTTFAELKIFLLKELSVPLPELKAQKEFVSFATQVDKSRFS